MYLTIYTHVIEPHYKETCLWKCVTRYDLNQSAQLQNASMRLEILGLMSIGIILSRKQMSRLMTKINKVACTPSEDSDQLGHLSSLIRVVTVRLKKH